MSDAPGSGERPRVLLLVTTQKDAEITQRLLQEVALEGIVCRSPLDVTDNIAAGASALLMTEEGVKPHDREALVSALHPDNDGLDLPTVLLTKGGTQSAMAGIMAVRLQNLTILERPAPVRSILSAVGSAVRARARQRELVRQMKRIRELQGQLFVALAASELGTFHCPLPLNTIIWDQQCKAHFWLPPEAEVDFDTFYQRIHPEDREGTRIAIAACVERGEKYDIEYRTVSPAGAIRWIRATGRVQQTAAGDPVSFSGTTMDVTNRKKLEEERDQLLASERAARVAGERANHLKDEFLATLSHELRTPLNAIVGWVELMKHETDKPDAIREGLEVIDRNVRVQGQLIDDLLDVSRIISGKVRLDVKPLQLDEVVHAALETVRPAALAKNVRLFAIVPPHLPMVTGDFGRLQQVIWNLLTNAVKFTPKDGKVEVLLEVAGSSLAVRVTDTGEGIAPEFLPHVFERFRQADGSPSRRHGGLGLGLSIVKTLVEMHGGQVSVLSAGQGQGATFTLLIPVRIAHAHEKPEARAPRSIPPFPLAVRPNLSGLTILILDDEPDARAMMHRLLQSCGATPIETETAAEASRRIAQNHPDIILSDIGLPDVDGYQFMRGERRKGLTVPAVALTAFARTEDRIRSIQAGFQAHLAKPIEPSELLTLIASICGRIPSND